MSRQLFCLMICLAACPSILAAPDQERTLQLTVTGYGKQFEEIDTADMVFSITTRHKEARVAKEQHDDAQDRCTKYLTENGFEQDKIQLRSTRLWFIPKHPRTPSQDEYACQTVYSMRTTSIDQLSDLQASLVERGVDGIQELTLFNSNRRDLEDDARRRAIDDAKQKAAFTCEQLGWKLGKPITIQYGNLRWYGHHHRNSAGLSPHGEFGNRGGGGGTSTTDNIGASTYVDANVTLTFEYTIE